MSLDFEQLRKNALAWKNSKDGIYNTRSKLRINLQHKETYIKLLINEFLLELSKILEININTKYSNELRKLIEQYLDIEEPIYNTLFINKINKNKQNTHNYGIVRTPRNIRNYGIVRDKRNISNYGKVRDKRNISNYGKVRDKRKTKKRL